MPKSFKGFKKTCKYAYAHRKCGLMKIGVGQIDTKVGDFCGNVEKILSAARRLAEDGADFAVFPECAVSGYPLKDLVFYKKFIFEAQMSLEEIARNAPLPLLVGAPRESGGSVGIFNSAYWVADGKFTAVCDKHLLPNYGALNDARNFDSGVQYGIVNFKGSRLGITICEDIWTLPSVSTAHRYDCFPRPLEYFMKLSDTPGRVDLLINISASVFSSENDNVRKRGGMLYQVSKAVNAPLLWCNLVGGCDEIIFAGGTSYIDATKGVSKTLPKFKESLAVIDCEKIEGYDGDSFDFNGIADVHAALVMALRDFINKIGIKKVLIGLSGGIDSAVVAALAVEALGPERVMGVSMPSRVSSQHSRDDARELAENLNIEFHTVGIAGIVEACEGALAPLFKGLKADVTEENIQSRSRGLVLMAISNKFGALVLTTGNKSECAVGYCTLYGDTCGGFAPICDVYKTDVYRLAEQINAAAGRKIIPQNTIDKPPSAELRPDQKDVDSLPPYDLLDAILKMHIDQYKSVSEIVDAGYPEDVVVDVAKKVMRAEYKRTQYPIGPKISGVAYSTDRKIPIAAKRGIQ